jgi:hypothetical protein
MTFGVIVAGVQLTLLCWAALFLAARQTALDRRRDIGLLKLRGAARWRVWSLTALQSALPMLAGALIGWILGYGGAAALAGTVDLIGGGVLLPLGLSAAAVAVVCVGSLVAAALAERSAMRSSVTDLLRRIPGRRTGWRAGIGDAVIVVLATAGVVQGYLEVRGSGESSVLALLAPGLVGLAAAVGVARTLPLVAARTATVTVRAARVGVALAALHLARRPGTHRVFAVMAVAVAILSTTALFWHTASVAWSERATAELGASRVLTVRADGAAKLLGAVRAVDPSGQYAMAVAHNGAILSGNRVLAVDSGRLTRVGLLPSAYGLPASADLARLLHPDRPAAPTVRDGALTLDVAGTADTLRIHLSTMDGESVQLDTAIADRRGAVTATVTGCGPAGCRLVALEPLSELDEAGFDLYGITQDGQPVVTAATLTDVSRWRPQLAADAVGPEVSAHDGRLSVTRHRGSLRAPFWSDPRVYVVDAATPLPIVLAGARPEPDRAGDARMAPLGSDAIPYEIVGTGAVLPRIGGSGMLVDLEYAVHSVGVKPESVALEVWLRADAPADVVTRLREAGVDTLQESTVDELEARLGVEGPGLALRFQLFAAAVMLLLAAALILLWTSIERRPRAEELAALRAQGLPDRSMRVAGYASTAVLVGLAVLTGLGAAVVAQAVVAASLPVFADSWTLLQIHRGAQPMTVLACGALALVVLGSAAAVSAARLVRTVRAARPETPGGDA